MKFRLSGYQSVTKVRQISEKQTLADINFSRPGLRFVSSAAETKFQPAFPTLSRTAAPNAAFSVLPAGREGSGQRSGLQKNGAKALSNPKKDSQPPRFAPFHSPSRRKFSPFRHACFEKMSIFVTQSIFATYEKIVCLGERRCRLHRLAHHRGTDQCRLRRRHRRQLLQQRHGRRRGRTQDHRHRHPLRSGRLLRPRSLPQGLRTV